MRSEFIEDIVHGGGLNENRRVAGSGQPATLAFEGLEDK